jgi:hypothetical protein
MSMMKVTSHAILGRSATFARSKKKKGMMVLPNNTANDACIRSATATATAVSCITQTNTAASSDLEGSFSNSHALWSAPNRSTFPLWLPFELTFADIAEYYLVEVVGNSQEDGIIYRYINPLTNDDEWSNAVLDLEHDDFRFIPGAVPRVPSTEELRGMAGQPKTAGYSPMNAATNDDRDGQSAVPILDCSVFSCSCRRSDKGTQGTLTHPIMRRAPNLSVLTFKTQSIGSESCRSVAQYLVAPQSIPIDIESLIGHAEWPLVRIGEVFQLQFDLSKCQLGPTAAKSVADGDIEVIPAFGQDAVRVLIGSDGAMVSIAVTFWDDFKQCQACLRCSLELNKCRCKTASDLLEIPRTTRPLQGSGKKKGSRTIEMASTNEVAGPQHIGILVRIPRNRANSADNSWLRKLHSKPGQPRLPKVMQLDVRVQGPSSPGQPASSTTLTGFTRLVAKNGCVKEKAAMSLPSTAGNKRRRVTSEAEATSMARGSSKLSKGHTSCRW